MLRRVLLILSVVGLASSVGLWAGSYWPAQVTFANGFQICLKAGGLNVHLPLVKPVTTTVQRPAGHVAFGVDGDGVWRLEVCPGTVLEGFQGFRTSWRPRFLVNGALAILLVPLWLIALVSAVPSGFIMLAGSSSRRRRLGLCLRCGYDLRGSPAACPECGHERG